LQLPTGLEETVPQNVATLQYMFTIYNQ